MKHIKQLANEIKALGGTLYFVGGVVRDEFLNRVSKDIDVLAVDISKVDLEQVLSKYTYKLCGVSFGVYKVKIDEQEIDVALPRKEVSTGTLHKDFEVEIGVTLAEDLQRRDFTINAMAKNVLTGELIDPYNGRKDLAKGFLKTTYENSIQDDYLRALRAIQFASRFGFKLSKQLIKDIKTHRELYHTLSAERVQMELTKLVKSPRILSGFGYLKFTGLLSFVLPELLANDVDKYNFIYHHFNTYYHILHALRNYNRDCLARNEEPDLIICLALLLHDVGKVNTLSQDQWGVWHNYDHDKVSSRMANDILHRLKYDSVTTLKVCYLIARHMKTDGVTDRLLRKLCNSSSVFGIKSIEQLIEVWYYDSSSCAQPMSREEYDSIKAKLKNIIDTRPPITYKDLAINGHDVMELGYEGKAIGKVLEWAMKVVLKNPEHNIKSRLLGFIAMGNSNHE